MDMNRLFPMAVALTLVLAGCGGSDTTPTETNAPVAPGSGGPPTTGIDERPGGVFIPEYTGQTPEEQTLRQENLIVYFEFDRSEIRPEFNAMLAAHGEYLANVPTAIHCESSKDTVSQPDFSRFAL